MPAIAGLDPAKALTQYTQDIWRSDTGLPNNSVTAMAQLQDGYLWLGTEEGLARFDGVRFTVFDKQNTPALLNNHISVLLPGSDDSLWIGTQGGGLTRLRKGSFSTYTTRDGLANDAILSLYEDEAGALWIGTNGGGLQRFQRGKFTTYTTKNGLPNNSIFAISGDRKGSLWIGTHAGLVHLEKQRFSIYTTKDGLRDNYINCLYVGPDGDIWAGTNQGGISHFVNGRLVSYTTLDGLSNDTVWSIYRDRIGTIWIGTNDGGLSRLRNGKFSTYSVKQGLPADTVLSSLEDREGNFWIGTRGGGLVRLKDSPFTVFTSREGLSNDVVLPVFEDHSGAIWAGTNGGGLNRLENGKTTTYSTSNGLSDNIVLSIAEDREHALWIATHKGLDRLSGTRMTHFTSKNGLPANVVVSLYTDHNGTLWAGTRAGLCHFDGRRFITYTTKDGLSNDYVVALYEDHRNILWIGTGGGLTKLENGRFISFTKRDGLSTNALWSVTGDEDGTIWIGTSGGGLNRLKNGKFTAYTVHDGLLDDEIFALLSDRYGNLWMSSNKGIFRVPKWQLNAYAEGRLAAINPTAYGTSEGLKNKECNGAFQPAGWQTKDGRLLFPTMEGLAIVDPARLRTNPAPPPVKIERITINNQSFGSNQTIQAKPGNGKLEFEFAALSLTASDKIRFKYKLDGFDREWIDAGSRRTAYYTNIPPGGYRFVVTARDGDGVWNSTASSLDLILEPHFYQTMWFRVLCALSIIGLMITAHLVRVRQHDQRERVLSQRVEERTKELRKEIQEHQRTQKKLVEAKEAAELASIVKSEFLANMSHEIRTPMHGVLGMTELALGTELTSEQFEYLTLAKGSAQSLLSIINDILDFSKIEAGKLELDPIDFNLRQILDECLKSLSIKAHEKGLELICDVDPALPEFLLGDPLRLRQILLNLIGNAIKFTMQGEIVLQVEFEHRDEPGLWLHFTVKDTGIGIPANRQKSIFNAFSQADSSTSRKFGGTGLGLGISSRLVRLMGGQIAVRSEMGVGSEFDFSVRLEPATTQERIRQPASYEELAGKAILVVDDNATNRRMLAAVLTRWGMKPQVAESGSTALSLLRQAHNRNVPFSMILTDCNMPGMDGFTFIESVRNDPQFTGRAIMMLSSGGQNGDVAHCRRLGSIPLLKPISVNDLRSVLTKAAGPVAPTAPSALAGDSAPTHTIAAEPLRILLAEDNVVNQKIAVRMLEKRGHLVQVVSNGVEALARLAEESFDLLLTDMQMPEMDGFETAAAIRALEKEIGSSHLPIIAMTALAMKGDQERCLAAGMDGYISKPVRASELFEVIERFSPTFSQADA